jgi:hypothetical protein
MSIYVTMCLKKQRTILRCFDAVILGLVRPKRAGIFAFGGIVLFVHIWILG